MMNVYCKSWLVALALLLAPGCVKVDIEKSYPDKR